MKPPPFDYFRPETLEQAVGLLRSNANAKVLAGGQSLMAMLNLRYVFPDVLVDINRIPGLSAIDVGPEAARIGGLTRQTAIERDATLRRVAPIFAETLPLVGHRQTRNRGTLGGSLCHLDPAAELVTLALLYDAEIEVAGEAGQSRRIPASDFVVGFMTPNIAPHEIVTGVEFPHWRPGHGYAFHEFSRRHGDFAVASAACLLDRDPDGTIAGVSIALGGVGSVPQRLFAAEGLLLDTRGEPDVVEAALDCCDGLEAIGDFHGSAEYRVSVGRAMLRKSLRSALNRATLDRATTAELAA